MVAPGEVGLALTHPTSCLSFCDVGVLYKAQSGSMRCVNTAVPVEAQEKEAVVCPQERERELHLLSSWAINKTTSQVPGS